MNSYEIAEAVFAIITAIFSASPQESESKPPPDSQKQEKKAESQIEVPQTPESLVTQPAEESKEK